MPKAAKNLSDYFRPVSYQLQKDGGLVQLTMDGQKLGPPGHRISLHQLGLKVISAKAVRFDKHGPVEIEITRINHLPTIQQVRLHSGPVMYPGRYRIELDYKIKPEKLAGLDTAKPGRELLPSIDEAEAWQSAEFKIKP